MLVTGAGGFIASHLVEALVERGAKVRAFVRYNSRGDPGLLALLSPQVYREIQVVAGDLRDLSALQTAVRGVTHVFHLGALIAIPYSYVHPAEVIETNVLGTLNVLLAGREAGVERIIHTSTSEVYGTAERDPMDEEHPLNPRSPYAATKAGGDRLAYSYAVTYDLPVVPHGHSVPATCHLIAAQPPNLCPLLEYLIKWNTIHQWFLKTPIVPVNGAVAVSTLDQPGIGMELDDAKITDQRDVTF